jgi:hypothetical protein
MSTTPYTILVGTGTLYIGAAELAAPATVETTPGAGWTSLGETDGGVKITKVQNIETFTTDQRTGNVKAVRTEEGLIVETNLTEATLENLANVINGTITDTAPGAGTIGTRALKLYKGADVSTYALLFRGTSPYGDAYAGQFYIPRGFCNDDVEMEFTKDGMTLIPFKFEALENLNAATAADRFGVVTYKDALAV